jgi:hypothetical protein
MLLNEFLKEHRKVQQLTKDFESKLAEQQKQIEALTAGVQKVTAQLEASKPVPQVVNNPETAPALTKQTVIGTGTLGTTRE